MVSASSTIVNVSPETAQQLAEFVCSLVAARKPEAGRTLFIESQAKIEAAQTEALLLSLLEHTDSILAADKETDAEGSFQALVPIIFTLQDSAALARVVVAVISALTASTTSKQRLRLQILVSIFNLMVASEAKYELLTAILSYACVSSQESAVAPYTDRVDAWIDAWALSLPQRRNLLRIVSDVVAANPAQASLALRRRVKYLDTFAGEEYPAEVLALATAALLNGINSAVTSYKDRSALLESFSRHASVPALQDLVALLRLLCEGSLPEYLAFAQSHGAFMQQHGISAEATAHSMRLLCLCSLGAQEPLLSYSRVAEALQVDRGAVEGWVVEAIAAGLVAATIDQLSETIAISRCVHRSFGAEQWVSLQQRLGAWRRSVAALVDAANKQQSASV